VLPGIRHVQHCFCNNYLKSVRHDFTTVHWIVVET
jgi:hypothetical protein